MQACLKLVIIIILIYILFKSVKNNLEEPIKIIDSFSYNGEIKALKLRLKELYDLVDNFVIVEAPYTFSGLQKELKFPIDKQQIPSNLLDKVTYIVYDKNTPKDGAWERERKQKNAIFYEGIRNVNLNKDDYIIYSDVDEIPNTKDLEDVIQNSVDCMQFKPHWFNFTLDNYLGPWQHHSIWLYKYGVMENKMGNDIRKISCPTFPQTSGWHLSYFVPPEQILEKLKSYSHYNDEKDRNVINRGIPYIIEKIKEGGELFGAAKRREFKDSYPKYADSTYSY